MRPCQTFHALEALKNSSSTQLYRKAVRLSRNDSLTVRNVYQQWLALLIDLDYLHPDCIRTTGTRLWFDLNQRDVLDVNNAFADCLARIYRQDTKGFKALCGHISPHLYHLIKDDLVLLCQSDTTAAGRLIQVFAYTSRLSLHDLDLTQQMIDDYLESESLIPSDYPSEIVSSLNAIVREWFDPYAGRVIYNERRQERSWQPSMLIPRHGPGGIAEKGRCSYQSKYCLLGTDALLSYAFPEISSLKPFDRISKTIFVPKSYKTFRTISMEPASLQYYQQAVWREIDQCVRTSPFLRNHIGFEDQTRNRRLAQIGSIERNFATIDLSAASDSVGYSLVKDVFRGTWLYRYLICLRSPRTRLPNGSVVELKKFAPMGSSLCFPIETIVFASICEKVARDHSVPKDYSVFGDDIIVPTSIVDDVMHHLAILGFRVNQAKSFFQQNCWFRESCGGEFAWGRDVTPLRISRKYDSVVPDERFTALVDLANSSYSRGFRHLRACFIAQLRSLDDKVMFSPDSLLGDNYTNYHLNHRQNPLLQREEVFCSALSSKPDKGSNEELRLRHWFESTALRKTLGDGFESNIGKTRVEKRRTWRSPNID